MNKELKSLLENDFEVDVKQHFEVVIQNFIEKLRSFEEVANVDRIITEYDAYNEVYTYCVIIVTKDYTIHTKIIRHVL